MLLSLYLVVFAICLLNDCKESNVYKGKMEFVLLATNFVQYVGIVDIRKFRKIFFNI